MRASLVIFAFVIGTMLLILAATFLIDVYGSEGAKIFAAAFFGAVVGSATTDLLHKLRSR